MGIKKLLGFGRGRGWLDLVGLALTGLDCRLSRAGQVRQGVCCGKAKTSGANNLIGSSQFYSFVLMMESVVLFHTREMVRRGVGHLRSNRKSTEGLGNQMC